MNLKVNNIMLYSSNITGSSNVLQNRDKIMHELKNTEVVSSPARLTINIKKFDSSYYNINRHILLAECSDFESFEPNVPKVIKLKLKTIQNIAGFVLFDQIDSAFPNIRIIDAYFFPTLIAYQSMSLSLNPFKLGNPFHDKISETISSLHTLQEKCYNQFKGELCVDCPHKNTCISIPRKSK